MLAVCIEPDELATAPPIGLGTFLRLALSKRAMKPLLLIAALCALGSTTRAQDANPLEQTPAKQTFRVPDKPRMELVFVLDTTSSMSGLIDGAKKKIWSIVNEIVAAKPQPEIRIGFVAYRDKGDAYVTQVHPLTGDLDAAFATLQTFSAQGGGDLPEHVSAGLHEAVSGIEWKAGGSTDSALYQVIFLVGDCPPHLDYDDGFDYKTEADKAAARGIFVNAIRCGDNAQTETVWLDIAKRGQGNYFTLAQSGGVKDVPTPFDEKMIKLGADLELTTVARRGLEGARDESLAAAGFRNGARGGFGGGEFLNENGVSNTIARQSFNAKSGQIYAAFDLVTQVVNGRVIEEIKDEEWPTEWEKKSPAEKRALLEAQIAERKKLKAQLAALEMQRNAFLKAELEKNGGKDGFDQKMLDTFKAQANARGGFVY